MAWNSLGSQRRDYGIKKGDVFYFLTVLKRAPIENSNQGQRYVCRCICGNLTVNRASALVHDKVKSCGCFVKLNRYRHGYTRTPTHISWLSMIKRCSNPNDKSYKRYGAKGIKVCSRWLVFENFLLDMGDRPVGTSLDRFPNRNGGYELANCRWATVQEQSDNRDWVNLYTHAGVTKSSRQWSLDLGGFGGLVQQRLKLGWALEKALTTRKQIHRKPK